MSPAMSRAENRPDFRPDTRLGYAAVAAAAILFSAKAVFIKMSYAHGAQPLVFMTLRTLFGLPFFLMLSWSEARKAGARAPMRGRDKWVVACLGVLGFYVSGMFNVHGLQYVSAGMERMILHVYPTLVVVFSALFFRKRLDSRLFMPLALCYAGIALSFGGEAAAGHASRPWLGGGLVFMSAVSYALYLVFQGSLIQRVGPQRITSYGMLAASAAVVGHFLLTSPVASLIQPAPVLMLSGITAVFCTVLPAYLLGYGIQKVGTGPAAVVSCVGPVFTFFLATALLGEPTGPLQAAGLAAVLGGGLMLAFGKEKRAAPAPAPAVRAAGEFAK